MPIAQPNDVRRVNLYKSIASNVIPVSFRMRQCETFTAPQATSTEWRTGVSSAPEKPRWVLIGLQTDKLDSQVRNAALFDHCNLTNMQVMLNHSRYPSVDMPTDFVKEKFTGIYKSFYDFASRTYGIDNLMAGSGVNPIAFKSLYPIHVFDVSKQSERLTEGIVDLTVRMEFRVAVPANTQAYALIISDRMLKFKSGGSKMSVLFWTWYSIEIEHCMKEVLVRTKPKDSFTLVVSENSANIQTTFSPPLNLQPNRDYELAMVNLETYYSFANIRKGNNSF